MDLTTVALPRPRSYAAGLSFRRRVSMTSGAELPLRALADAPAAAAVSCHPCDEAIVRHLICHVGRLDCDVRVDPSVSPGELALSVQLAVAI
jgi:hypothetical protein